MLDRARFYDAVREFMPYRQITPTQFEHIQDVVDGLETRSIPENQSAYILATAHHETDHWRVLEEYASGRAYEGRKDLGNTQSGDGQRFKGRGYVMITGRSNYTDWSKRLGVDFVTNPKLVSDPRYARQILIDGMLHGTFTGVGLPRYVNETKTDFYNARRTVNRLDRASHIAGIAVKYQNAMKAASYLPPPPPKPEISDNPVLRRGSSGEAVARLQGLLNAQGAKLTVDSDFGPATESALIGFQKTLIDYGVTGKLTWAALGASTGGETVASVSAQPSLLTPITDLLWPSEQTENHTNA